MKHFSALLTIFSLLLAPLFVQADELTNFLESRSVAGQVYFTKGSSQLSSEHQQLLDKLSNNIKTQTPGHIIRIEGFASPEGSKPMNYELANRRALTVQAYLQKRGVSAELFFVSFGEKNISTAKLSEQRRVDIAIYQETRAVKDLFRKTGRVERIVIQ